MAPTEFMARSCRRQGDLKGVVRPVNNASATRLQGLRDVPLFGETASKNGASPIRYTTRHRKTERVYELQMSTRV
jgi:hypothetical protein